MSNRKMIEQLWAIHKYEVMLHSQRHYNAIRQAMKSNPTEQDIRKLIDEALDIETTEGSLKNTADHIWGYFKKCATDEEKAKYLALKARLTIDEADEMLAMLYSFSVKYDVNYLIQSSIFRRYQ